MLGAISSYASIPYVNFLEILNMSNGAIRRAAIEDLDLVHNLIEQCLQLHLSKRDAVSLIFREANIDPGYTELVWEQLEQENPEFFECYCVRLALKQQIELFNELLRQQAALTQQITNGVATSPGSNGSHISGNGSHTSGDGSHISGNGSGILGNGYHASENGSHRPVNGCLVPENGSHMPVNGSHRPENGSHKQVNGSLGPENGSHMPVNGSHRAENGSYRPVNGCHMPVNGSHRPENRSYRPVNGSLMTENGSHMPVNGSHRPVNGPPRPENASDGPVNGSYRAGNASHSPVNGSYGAENVSHRPTNGSFGPVNGSHMQHLAQNGGCYPTGEAGLSTRTRDLQPAMSSNVPSAFTSGMSMLQMPAPFDVSAPSRGIDFLPQYNTFHVQSSNSTDLIQGLNEETIRPGNNYSDSQAIFQTYGDVVGTRTSVEGAPFSCVDASSQILNESLLAVNGCSFGHFGQIPGNFSLPDLSTAYPNETENYANASFGTTFAGSFFASQEMVEIPEDTSGGISGSLQQLNEDLRSD